MNFILNKCFFFIDWLSFDKTNICFHFERCLVTDVEWSKSVEFIYRKNRTIARLWIRTRNWLASVALWYFVCDARKPFIHTTYYTYTMDVNVCLCFVCLFNFLSCVLIVIYLFIFCPFRAHMVFNDFKLLRFCSFI